MDLATALGWAVFGQALLTAAVLAMQPAIRTRQLASLAVGLVGLAATIVTSLNEPEAVGDMIALYALNILASAVVAPAFFIHLFGLSDRSLRRHLILPAVALFIAIIAIVLALAQKPVGVADVGPAMMVASVALVVLDLVTIVVQIIYLTAAAYRVLSDPVRSSWTTALLISLGGLLALDIVSTILALTGFLEGVETSSLELPSIAVVAVLSVFGLVRATSLVERPAPVAATIDKYLKAALAPDRAREIAERALALLERAEVHADPTLSLPKLASRLGVKPNVLSQALNGAKAISYADAVNSARIRAACRLLSTTDQAVVDIAIAVGFNSKSTFHSAFSKHVGTTPAAYRTSASKLLNNSTSAESGGDAR